MIRQVLTTTDGDYIGFVDDENLRYRIDRTMQGRLEELADGAERQTAVIDREHAFDGATAMKATEIERDGAGARIYIERWPSALVLTRTECATLAYAMNPR